MKVSFLVTYYNQEKYVKKSIESILAIEKPFEWEILVGDDGSTDNTVDIVREYMDIYPDNLFLFVRDRNDGVRETVQRASLNRLNLLEHAEGDYFCVLDGDDSYCDTSFIQDAIGIFDSNDGISIVAFGYKMYSDAKGLICEKRFEKKGHINTVDYLKYMYTHAGACVYRNIIDQDRLSILKKYGFFDDNDILINSLYYGGIYSVNRVIYSYRQTTDSTYNSMDRFERALLNFQGYDVDRLLLPDYDEELRIRYVQSIITLFYYRKKTNQILSVEKISIYKEAMKGISKSYTRNYLENNSKQDKETSINDLFFSILFRMPFKVLRFMIYTIFIV